MYWDNISPPRYRLLESYKLPIFAVGRFRHPDCAYNYFNRISALNFPNFNTLKKNKLFKKLAQDKSSENLNEIIENKGIIVTRCSGENVQSKLKFKIQYPDFIIVNMEIGKYARYKNQTDKLFSTPPLKKYRPKCGIYKKEYSQDLAQKIITDLGCDHYVIKPTNSFSGNGIRRGPHPAGPAA